MTMEWACSRLELHSERGWVALCATHLQVGHIPRQVAAQLTPQMDLLREGLRVEGYIPRGSGNVRTPL